MLSSSPSTAHSHSCLICTHSLPCSAAYLPSPPGFQGAGYVNGSIWNQGTAVHSPGPLAMHSWCPVQFPPCSPALCCFLPWLFLASLLSFSSRILNFHDFSTGDCIFPSHMSCQTVGFPIIFSLKDLYVLVALTCFHLGLIFLPLPIQACPLGTTLCTLGWPWISL